MNQVLRFLWVAIFLWTFQAEAGNSVADTWTLKKTADEMEKIGKIDSSYINIVLSLTANLKFVDPDLGLSYLRKILEPAGKQADKRFLCNVYYQIGQQYAAKGLILNALDHYIIRYKTLPTENERIEHGGFIILDIGNIYFKQKNYHIAATFFEKALYIFQNQHIEDGVKVAISNIALVKNQLNQLDSSLYYFNKVIVLATESKDTIRLAYNLGWTGDVHFKMRQFSESLKWYQHALDLALILPGSIEDKQVIASLNLRMGNALQAQNKTWQALEHIKYAIRIANPNKDYQNLFAAYHTLSNIYAAQGNDGLALAYIDSAYAVSITKCSFEFRKEAVIEQCRLLINLKRNDEAQLKLSEYNLILDSIANEATSRKVLELNTVMDTFQLQAKNESLVHEKQERVYYLLAVIGVLLMIVIMIIIMLIIRRKNEKKLKKIADDLKNANATKDKFFSIIAHDLRGPLHTIMGFSEILDVDYEKYSDKEKHHFISTIHNLTIQLNRLLQNLLEWSRVQIGSVNFNPAMVDLGVIAAETSELISESAQLKQITVVNAISLNTQVFADENMLRVVLRNLLTNAVKFTYENGRIKIDSYKENGHIVIVVEDNGMGIPLADHNRVFRIGENVGREGTAKEKSTGLGLVLCKEFVEKCGGTIWVESIPDTGSRFFFTLPLNPNN
jgi:signal transduction histidine kinase